MIPDETKAPNETKKSMTAVSLRSMLGATFFVTIVIGIAFYYLGFQSLEKFAVEVSHKVADADASSQQIQGLQALKSQIDRDGQLISKADNIFATQDSYQNQAVKDIQRYADLSGVTIANTSFSETPSANSRSFSVELGASVSYNKLLAFLDAVENNVPKLQVMRLTIERATTGGDAINVNNVSMTILVR